METPTGAIVDYKYRRDKDDPLTGGFIAEANDIPGEIVTKKTVTHDGTTDVWNYDVGLTTGTVSGPDGSVTTETFYSHHPGVSSYYGGDKAGLVYIGPDTYDDKITSPKNRVIRVVQNNGS
jgi:hypothetical protein